MCVCFVYVCVCVCVCVRERERERERESSMCTEGGANYFLLFSLCHVCEWKVIVCFGIPRVLLGSFEHQK